MKPKIYTSEDHHIRHDHIDSDALHVIQTLQKAGYEAYLVGGGVRDLLLHKHPKDFDISTSARPEEVKKLFRRCLLIGRRFRLAHVRFGRKIIEVATFRAGDPDDAELIVRDNIYGTPEEDVMRRDFTINGLCYDPHDHKIIDFVGGFEDLQHHLLRVIGDPTLRFKQDPVRMLRLLKFRARFDFKIEQSAQQALETHIEEISKSAPARVLEEVFKMLESGSSEAFFRLMVASKCLEILFPGLFPYFHGKIGEEIFAFLRAADEMNKKGRYKTLDRSILVAAILYPILGYQIEGIYLKKNKQPHIGQIIDLSHAIIHELLFEAAPHFPRRIRQGCQMILQMQYRITPLDPKKQPRTRIVHQKEFQLPLTFLKLRSVLQPSLFKTYDHWKHLHRKAQGKE